MSPIVCRTLKSWNAWRMAARGSIYLNVLGEYGLYSHVHF